MGPVTPALTECEDTVWFRHSDSLPAAARGAARQLAHRIGLLPERAAEVALAVSEAATNLRRHAVDGAMVLRVVRTDTEAALEFLTVDSGPGMADVPAALADGYSSGPTLGIGLGAISRLADAFDLHSLPGRGTVLTARFWNRTPAGRAAAAAGEPPAAGLTRPMSGQELCGDAWAVRPAGRPAPGPAPVLPASAAAARLDWSVLTNRAPRTHTVSGAVGGGTGGGGAAGAFLLMFCDGLGHGPLAARAASDATAAFHRSPAQEPSEVLADLHRALRSGRGGAVAVALVEPVAARLTFCGVGNVSAFVVDTASGTRRSLPSSPGIVGHQLPAPHTVRQELPPGSVVVLHSDGLTDRWRAADTPGLFSHLPVTAAALLLREAGVRRDDAGVVIAKGTW
ncbi:SpoIIE family protein phosphatase [Kitasatospora sp. NA04385]|uniref:ATP-binding SpoIIE family protein phosphatase n=1 Tax=Kitasatospora sp. NA04385 TaxID=2742135 RepID=UPI001590C7FF|nr:ATP-binding SpoIIE family protein phosphatase [Kitasatospora sp. NA04385]QKW17999.1 SpoIIE family protein phosphatase [Kitasatospora sp. NA04385]